jgi:hypothetical protein
VPSMKLINYDQLVHEALRDVVRDVLCRTQEKGLPGEHHFYITFKTEAAQIADWLRKRYPDEMTVVIQKQYEALVVDDDKFSITLYFDNRPERLIIPFKAMTGFADPHASFSLRMAANISLGDRPPPPDPKLSSETAGQVVELDSFRDRK